MDIPDNILEITDNDTPGYHPLTYFEGWRVAIYNEKPVETPGGISYLEKHEFTDEVFILLKGFCTLFVSGGRKRPDHIRSVTMEPLRCYNVRKGVWHNLILSDSGAVAIVENHNTSRENSEYYCLDDSIHLFEKI